MHDACWIHSTPRLRSTSLVRDCPPFPAAQWHRCCQSTNSSGPGASGGVGAGDDPPRQPQPAADVANGFPDLPAVIDGMVERWARDDSIRIVVCSGAWCVKWRSLRWTRSRSAAARRWSTAVLREGVPEEGLEGAQESVQQEMSCICFLLALFGRQARITRRPTTPRTTPRTAYRYTPSGHSSCYACRLTAARAVSPRERMQ